MLTVLVTSSSTSANESGTTNAYQLLLSALWLPSIGSTVVPLNLLHRWLCWQTSLEDNQVR
jgi:hypothetical protein